MHIAKIVIEGFICYRDPVVLELPACPIAVTATYSDDPRRSNWAGKTAFLEAFDWCLFGVHRKRLESDVINRESEQARVQIMFSDGMVVTRVRRPKSQGFSVLAADGETYEKKAAEEYLTNALGMTWEQMRLTIRMEQGDTEALVGDESGKRQKAIRSWLKLEPFDFASARARKIAGDASLKSKGFAERVLMLEVQIEEFDDAADIKDLAEARESDLAAHRAQVAAMERGMDEMRKDLDELRGLQRWDEVIRKGKRLKNDVSGFGDIVAQCDVSTDKLADLQEGYKRASQIVREIRDVLGGHWDEMCPVTMRHCPVSSDIVAEKDLLKARLKPARVIANNAEARVVEAQQTDSVLKLQRSALDRAIGQLKELRAEAIELKPRVTTWKEETGMDSVSEGYTKAVAKHDSLKMDLEKARGDLQQTHEELRSTDRAVTQLATLESDLNGTGEEMAKYVAESAAARVAARCLGSSGVPRIIAESRVLKLRERCNVLLEGTGLSIDVSWRRATQKLEGECGDCGFAYKGQRDKTCPGCGVERSAKMEDAFEILVDDGSGVIEDVKMKSGGARVLVGVAFRLAGGAMLRELRGSPVGWALIDEAMGPLDAANREKLTTAFSSMLAAVGLEQALIVSHDAGVLDSLPARIQVVRGNGASTLEVS